MQKILFIFSFFLLFQFSFSQNGDSSISDTHRNIIVNDITISGNKLTKENIILRELLFSKKDTIDVEHFNELIKLSRENLLNTSLFNFVTITQTPSDTLFVSILIEVTERWYIWPFPLFELAETNFNTWWLTKDFSRTNYGFYVVKENFRGRRETLKIRARFGYSEQYALQYSIPYINKKNTSGIGLTAAYSRRHEVTYKTIDNERQFYKNPDDYAIKGYFARFSYSLRKQIYNSHTFQLEYENTVIDDSINSLTNDFFKNNTTAIDFFTLTWYFKRDKRDIKSYPLKGYFFDFELDKIGLGITKNENVNLLLHYMTFKKFWQLSNRFYFASGIKTKLTFLETPSYYFQTGLGYGVNIVRGYEYYVIDGQQYGLLKTNLKYELVKPRIGKINFLHIDQFNTFHYAVYLNLFADAAYVKDKLYASINSLSNSWLYGTGIGLDYVTYYDIVLRFEYSLNRRGEHGFFFDYIRSI